MTAWKHDCLCLFVLLSLINLSEEGCYDYLTMEKRNKYLNHTVYLIKTEKAKDILECTVERECLNKDKPYCDWLDHCHDRMKPETVTAKCKGEPSVELSHYHFACLVSNYTAEGCNYEHVCKLYKERRRNVSVETKPSQRPSTTTTTTTTKATLPETTAAAASPTTTLPEATTTAATSPTTTLPDTTRATTTATTTTLPDTTRTTTTTVLSPTVTLSTVSRNNANHSQSVGKTESDDTNTDHFKILLAISLIFNVIAVLGGLYMHRRWMQDRKLLVNMVGVELNRYLPEAQVMTEPKSEMPPSSANMEEENTQLMTIQDCQSIVIRSADGEDTSL